MTQTVIITCIICFTIIIITVFLFIYLVRVQEINFAVKQLNLTLSKFNYKGDNKYEITDDNINNIRDTIINTLIILQK